MDIHFSGAGLRGFNKEKLTKLFTEQIGSASYFTVADHRYRRIAMGKKLVYWLGFREDEDSYSLVSYSYHYHSDNRNRVWFSHVISSDEEDLMGMARVHLFLPEAGKDVPLNLALPLLPVTDRMSYGCGCGAQITARAEAARCWHDPKIFEHSFPDDCHPAAEHVMPSGVCAPSGEANETQAPKALIGGKIAAVKLCTNTVTKDVYWHITLDSFGVLWDVLADPDVLEGQPVVGGILHGSFCLTAMLYQTRNERDFIELTEYSAPEDRTDETPEEEQDSAGCTITVTRPASARIMKRIRNVIASLELHACDYLIVQFCGTGHDSEFIQTVLETRKGGRTYFAEYSRVENGKQVIRVRRHMTLDETVKVFAEACRVPAAEFDFTGWLDNGFGHKNDRMTDTEKDAAGDGDSPEDAEYEEEDEEDGEEYDDGYDREEAERKARTPRMIGSFPHFCAVPDFTQKLRRYMDIVEADSFSKELRAADSDSAVFSVITEAGSGTEGRSFSLDSIMQDTAFMLYGCNIDTDGMQVSVSNDPEGELRWERDPEIPGCYRISLCADTPDDWCQTIYQIGYTFTHCVLDYRCGAGRIPWIEETICEMMSVWLLTFFANHWSSTRLSGRDDQYATHIREYVQEFMTEQEWTDLPSRCGSREELLRLNDDAGERSAERVGTVIHLYCLTYPADLEGLLNYGAFVRKDAPGLVDTRRWVQACPNNLAVRYLASIQDQADETVSPGNE